MLCVCTKGFQRCPQYRSNVKHITTHAFLRCSAWLRESQCAIPTCCDTRIQHPPCNALRSLRSCVYRRTRTVGRPCTTSTDKCSRHKPCEPLAFSLRQSTTMCQCWRFKTDNTATTPSRPICIAVNAHQYNLHACSAREAIHKCLLPLVRKVRAPHASVSTTQTLIS